MTPIGKIDNVDAEELTVVFQSMRPEETIPGWAFRFLQSIPGVTMVLSGMSNMEQLKANIATYESDKPLNQEEMDTLVKKVDEEVVKGGLPCTMNTGLQAAVLLLLWQWAV
ncbi:MAG: hypothetical protein HDR07_02690 [Lachnospiraceae bacterium]|nr:hypothetical protein [Lachnospiraceae bacterium]